MSGNILADVALAITYARIDRHQAVIGVSPKTGKASVHRKNASLLDAKLPDGSIVVVVVSASLELESLS